MKKSTKSRKDAARNNRLEFEIAFFEKLLQEDHDFTEVMIPLAEDYTMAKRYEEGLKIDKRLSELLPDDPYVHYNLACSLSLVNRLPESAEALATAIRKGYEDFAHIERDPDLSNLRAHQTYIAVKRLFKGGH